MPFNYEKRLQQERLDEYYLNKKRIQEHHNKKIQLDKLMLEKYWEKIEDLRFKSEFYYQKCQFYGYFRKISSEFRPKMVS